MTKKKKPFQIDIVHEEIIILRHLGRIKREMDLLSVYHNPNEYFSAGSLLKIATSVGELKSNVFNDLQILEEKGYIKINKGFSPNAYCLTDKAIYFLDRY